MNPKSKTMEHTSALTSVVPSLTANGRFRYSNLYFGKSLDAWIKMYSACKPGTYDYDSWAVSLAYLFRELTSSQSKYGDPTLDAADAVHRGWCENYAYWRDKRPWGGIYQQPATLTDTQRERRCGLSFNSLSAEERARYIAIAKTILSCMMP